jgi:hypothetical protein
MTKESRRKKKLVDRGELSTTSCEELAVIAYSTMEV